ncbi:MAG TPA: hypothetical protein VFD77_04645 [Brumimicrobium sp.]|nr:hypothetical protein [Brumimicrobium sp.]
MDNKDTLQKEINELTNKIRKERPTTYKHLMESPSTVPNSQNKNSDDFVKSLEKYRNELLEILKTEK